MVIEELLVKLGFFSDLKGLQAFKAEIAGVRKSIISFVSQVEAAGLAISGFFAHSLEGIDEQAKFARQVGVTVEQLQQLQYAANISGSSTQDLDASMRNLSKSIFEASEGVGGAVEVFGRLGINTYSNGKIRSTIDVLKELADKIKSLPSNQQQEFSGRIGISPSTILLLQKGRSGINELISSANQLGIYSEKDAKKAEAYADSWRSLIQVFKVLKTQVALGLAPIFTETIKNITAWLTVNKELIIQDISLFIKGVIFVLKVLFIVLSDIVKLMQWVIALFGSFKNILEFIAISAGLIALRSLPTLLLKVGAGLKIIRDAILVINAALLLDVGLLLLVVAGFVVLVALIQDAWVWIRGGKSEIGDMFGTFKEFIAWLKNIYHYITDPMIQAFKDIKEFFSTLIDDIEKDIDRLKNIFGSIKSKVSEHFNADLSDIILPGRHGVLSQSIPLTNGTQVSNIINNSNSTGDSNSASSNANTFNITVNGGSSNQDISAAVQRGIYDAARQAQRNNSSPVVL